jgi:hypothetical protein
VQGVGYLELWNRFPNGGIFFTRTLADVGPLAKLSGDSDWRAFELPFEAWAGTTGPEEMILNVVLPGHGGVEIGPLEVEALEPSTPSFSNVAPWWSDRTAGTLVGILGGVAGLIGALIGVLTSLGRARTLVFAIHYVLIALGGVSLSVGIYALTEGQPFFVCYPLLLLGVVLAGAFGGGLRKVRKTYRDKELLRMEAMDARLP